jgi:hypothetical protein
MELGIYLNLFEAGPKLGMRKFVAAPRSTYPSLDVLRKKINDIMFYSHEDKVIAIGQKIDNLEELGFVGEDVDLSENPKLVAALLREGFLLTAQQKGYEVIRGFSNLILDRQRPIETLLKELLIFQGFEARSIFISNPYTSNLAYGFIVDLRFKFEIDGSPASYPAIIQYAWEKQPSIATQVVRDVRVRTGDLLADGGFNTESSRWRMGKIQQFMAEFNSITLPDGTTSSVSTEPMRVVIGGR